MDIFLLNEQLQRETIIRKYRSFTWNTSFQEAGNFELVLGINMFSLFIDWEDMSKTVFVECSVDQEHIGIVEVVSKSEDEDGIKVLTVRGRMAEEALLQRRVPEYIMNYKNVSASLAIADLMYKNFGIDAGDSRVIDVIKTEPVYIPRKGLVAEHLFDEVNNRVLYDTSGNGNNLISDGTEALTLGEGWIGEQILEDNNETLGLGGLTWLNDLLAKDVYSLSVYLDFEGYALPYSFLFGAGVGGYNFLFYKISSEVALRVGGGASATLPANKALLDIGTPAEATGHYVFLVNKHNEDLKVYRNGEYLGKASTVAAAVDSTLPLAFNDYYESTANVGFIKHIDQMRFYDRLLTEDDIKSLANEPATLLYEGVGNKISFEAGTDKNVYEHAKEIASLGECGFKLSFEADGNDEIQRSLRLVSYVGVNRSLNQNVNDRVVIGQRRGTSSRIEFYADSTSRGTAVVGRMSSEEVGSAGSVMMWPEEASEGGLGLRRFEKPFDLSNVSRTTEDEYGEQVDIPEEEVVENAKQLMQMYLAKVKPKMYVTGQLPLHVQRQFREKFSLGDIVTVIDDETGFAVDSTILNAQEIWSVEGYSVQVDIGERSPVTDEEAI